MLTKPTPRFVAIQSSYWAYYCSVSYTHLRAHET